MQVDFKYSIGQRVTTDLLAGTGVIRSSALGRDNVRAYWIEYLDNNGVVREVYVAETDIKHAV